MKLLWARKGLPAWKLIDDLTAPFPGGIITYAKGVALTRMFYQEFHESLRYSGQSTGGVALGKETVKAI